MVEVRVNGKTFQLFKQVDITRSMDNFSGEARILCSEQVDDQSFIVMNNLVEIFFDGISVIAGYAEKISDSENTTTHDVSFRVRDKVADIIDSAVPESLKTKTIEGITKYSDLCQLVVDGIGLTSDIKVIDEVGATINADDIKAAEIGSSSYSYLDEYARKVQVFLNTDGKGNVLIRNQFPKLKTILAHVPGFDRNNIKSSNVSFDYSGRFYKYIVRSNGSLSSKDKTSNVLNSSGEAIDPEIRQSRIFEKIAETSMTEDECRRAAEEEANIRRIRSFNYTCSVAGFTANGELWDVGNLVSVKDTPKQVMGLFLIKDISWSSSANGEITNMTITYPDAYQVTPTPDALTEKTTTAGDTYTVKKGDNLSTIGAQYGLDWRQLAQLNPQIENPRLIEPGWEINIPKGTA